MDFFSMQRESEIKKNAPLAERMRPRTIDEYIGQSHIVGEGQPLNRLIRSDRIGSMIFFGPPGTGKTTLATVIANTTEMDFQKISAVTAGVKEIREVIVSAKDRLSFDRVRTILFIDEIHRFNKSQQDALLPHVENGTVILIGATTENPFFEVNKALISRCQIMELKPLKNEELREIVGVALSDRERGLGEYDVTLDDDALDALIIGASGDARIALNSLEIAVLSTDPIAGKIHIDLDAIRGSMQKKVAIYDKGEEEHYNTISAFIKSVRGSDPDAAVYYLARMLAGGEDPLFIARRLCILASEDIGNAEPMGLVIANSCYQACSQIGMPEAQIILSQTTTFLASAPKSNAAYLAIASAASYVRDHGYADIPAYLKDAHYSGAKKLDRGLTYKYPHDYPNGYVEQQYLPDEVQGAQFYAPKPIGEEEAILLRLQNKDKGAKQ